MICSYTNPSSKYILIRSSVELGFYNGIRIHESSLAFKKFTVPRIQHIGYISEKSTSLAWRSFFPTATTEAGVIHHHLEYYGDISYIAILSSGAYYM